MSVFRVTVLPIVGLVALAATACTGAKPTELDAVGLGGGVLAPATPQGDGDDTDPGGAPGGGGKADGGSKKDTGGSSGECAFQDDKDRDGDGLSFAQGDCNDCNAKVRPGFTDIAGNGIDEDCSGKADDDDVTCDDGLALASTSAADAAKALGLCKKTTPGSAGWGVLEARWTKPDGTPTSNNLSWGLLPKLGANLAPSGKAMLALSTGTARGPADPGYVSPSSGYDKGYTHPAPGGQTRKPSVCAPADPAPGAAHDGVALELKIRVPLDANSMSFTHQFFTSDTPSDACSQYNDAFVVMLDPKPAGSDGNIVLDALGDPLTVSSTSLLRACTAGTFKGLVFGCPLGVTSLVGTGFDGKSATGWLRTTAPVKGGADITLRFAVWDSGDGIVDSTALVDELSFSVQKVTTARTVPR